MLFDIAVEKKPAKVFNCSTCGRGGIPKTTVFGTGKRNVLIVTDMPSAEDARRGLLLVDENGMELRRNFSEQGWNITTDCWVTSAVLCPGDDADNKQVKACFTHIDALVRKLRPSLVILLGATAVESVITRIWKETGAKSSGKKRSGVFRWRGFVIPSREWNCWLAPIEHPAIVNRFKNNAAAQFVWKQDIRNALLYANCPVVFPKEETSCVQILTETDAVKYLRELVRRRPQFLAWDYETTGLKPENPEQKIVSCAVAPAHDESVAFPWCPQVERVMRTLLLDPAIGKIASNMKFEHRWTIAKLGIEVQNWVWDTMLAEHILDNRPGICSIKFIAFRRFGLLPYNTEVEQFLQGENETNKNSLNRIHMIPMDKLLLYNGMDSLLEYRVAMLQMQEVKHDGTSSRGDDHG